MAIIGAIVGWFTVLYVVLVEGNRYFSSWCTSSRRGDWSSGGGTGSEHTLSHSLREGPFLGTLVKQVDSHSVQGSS